MGQKTLLGATIPNVMKCRKTQRHDDIMLATQQGSCPRGAEISSALSSRSLFRPLHTDVTIL